MLNALQRNILEYTIPNGKSRDETRKEVYHSKLCNINAHVDTHEIHTVTSTAIKLRLLGINQDNICTKPGGRYTKYVARRGYF